jgi:hypothetical protein
MLSMSLNYYPSDEDPAYGLLELADGAFLPVRLTMTGGLEPFTLPHSAGFRGADEVEGWQIIDDALAERANEVEH